MAVTFRALSVGKLQVTPGVPGMRRLAQSFLLDSRKRIESGTGSSGRKMKRYSPDYAKFRAAHGRVTDRRTLVYSDRMLATRQVKRVTEATAVIGWPPGEEAVKALANETRTPFVNPTPGERKALISRAKQMIKANMKRSIAQARTKK